ncbi:tRNA pseudouridine(38-40) synthase TruA [Lacipirellula limnantheis]|uniref:tRNA pseudouridine synthase A n=1 Tax=Lacipirellula limnantheis TaxID=2528024 RepID=A0A517U2N5_9BACT|nr:tRNA pseudouridine(38-40) synthase TruA [Lacipirellula limnantheis]QDT74877.1 tRNA pseudouridine synthase A [Lacipirellula limnantheis]
MPSFKITLAYDGAAFSGWQAQPGRRTVQGELERAWLEITGETVRLNAAGRTDAGVHAAGQVVSVESTTTIPPESLVPALNSKLPEDAAVQLVECVADGFHATHDAKFKRYRYTIYNDARRPVFCRNYAWHIPTPLDVVSMQVGGAHMVGTHDFASFQSVGSERDSTVRTIFAVDILSPAAPGSARGSARPPTTLGPNDLRNAPRAEPGAAIITIDVEGDGFLYNMVRTIAGTLVEVGRGKRPPEWVAEVIAAKDRCAAGQTAPPHGLCLQWVAY